MSAPFPRLFSPARCGSLELPNRLVFAATSSELADREGFLGDEAVEFYAERARGGVGLVVVEATYIEQEGKRLYQNAMLHEDRFIPGLRKLVDAVHRAGAKVALQLNHGGREATPAISGSVPLAPSALAADYIGVGEAVVPKALTMPEIERIVRRFVEAAVRAREAGFDAIELHGAHGYLISEFFSPHANRRTDRYGGDVAGRARFCIEIVQGIKRALGDDYPVIVRMNGRDHFPGGLEADEAAEIAVLLEAAGADSISVSGGVHSSRPYMVIPGMSVGRNCFGAETAAIRKRLRIPVMTVGRIKTPELAEALLAQGQADFVCMSRALLADPALPNKARAGAVDAIVPCIACNECITIAHRHEGMACTVNPMVGRELKLKPLLQARPARKTVCVVGSGAAGLAAAVTAASRGHEVHLFERDARIGGQLNLACMPPNREEIGTLLDYFKRRLDRLKVTVHLGSAFTAADARRLGADAIFVATGAKPLQPRVPGAELPHVMTGWEVLAGVKDPGGRCVVVGGGLVGIEVADHLAEHGCKVTLIARSELLKKAVHADRVYFLDRIAALGIEVLTHTGVARVEPGRVEIAPQDGSLRWLEDVDSVVFCMGYESRKDEALPLLEAGVPVHYVGDVLGPRKFFQAVEEGTLAALEKV
ncbi:MAG: FAD-dependent oxidoreductase [Rubrivivax sp.]